MLAFVLKHCICKPSLDRRCSQGRAISNISSDFVLWEAVFQTKHCCSIKVKIFACQQKFWLPMPLIQIRPILFVTYSYMTFSPSHHSTGRTRVLELRLLPSEGSGRTIKSQYMFIIFTFSNAQEKPKKTMSRHSNQVSLLLSLCNWEEQTYLMD